MVTSVSSLGTFALNRNSKEIIIEMVNAFNNSNIKLEDVLISSPVPIVSSNKNTSIKIMPEANSGLYGVKTVNYNRLHISTLSSISVLLGNATTTLDLLNAINEKYGVLLNDRDIVSSTLNAPQGDGSRTGTLTMSNNSLIFYGSAEIVASDTPSNTPAPTTVGVPVTYSSISSEAQSVITLFVGQIVDINIATININSSLPITRFESDTQFQGIPIVQVDPGQGSLSFWYNPTTRLIKLKGTVQANQTLMATEANKGFYVENQFNLSLTQANLVLRIQVIAQAYTSRAGWYGDFAYSTPYVAHDTSFGKMIYHPGPSDERACLEWTNRYGPGEYEIFWQGSEDSQASGANMELWIKGVKVQTFFRGVGTYSGIVSLIDGETIETQMSAVIGDGGTSFGGGGKYVILRVTKVSTGTSWDSYLDYINAYGLKVQPWDYFGRNPPSSGYTKFEFTKSSQN